MVDDQLEAIRAKLAHLTQELSGTSTSTGGSLCSLTNRVALANANAYVSVLARNPALYKLVAADTTCSNSLMYITTTNEIVDQYLTCASGTLRLSGSST